MGQRYVLPETRHPKTGIGYVHVIEPGWGPAVDLFAGYSVAAARTRWLSVMTPSEFAGQRQDAESPYWTDDSLFYTLWSHAMEVDSPERRQSKLARVYFEAFNADMQHMLPAHQEAWARFQKLGPAYDATFVHTPLMADWLHQQGVPCYVLPLGWEPEAMGRPRWNAPKFTDYVFQGSVVGRRAAILPLLAERLGRQFQNQSGAFGRGLLGILDTAIASIYIAHSNVRSFSTWRIWQCAASSAALVAEAADSWPAVPDDHYVAMPYLTFENIDAVCDWLRTLPQNVDLAAVARRMHDDVGQYFTLERCIDDYLVPASREIFGR